MTTRARHIDEDLIWAEWRSPRRPAPALFLDRDGVIIEDTGHLHKVHDIEMIPGVERVIAEANRRGVHVVVVTNQSGIGQGIFRWEDFAEVQSHILETLAGAAAHIDAVLACPFTYRSGGPYVHPDHPDRKPNPGMLLKAAEALHVDLARSWIIGDRATDMSAGRNAGIAGGLHVLTGAGREERDLALAETQADFAVRPVASVLDALEVFAREF